MFAQPEAYLDALRTALSGQDPAQVQDALREARSRIQREGDRLAWEAPDLEGQARLDRIIAALGTPEAFAEAFRQRERVVTEAFQAPEDDPEPNDPAPWPSFFGILAEPRAYGALFYLFSALITGIFYFTWVVTGLSLSLSLLFLVVGFPLLVLVLGSFRALAHVEGRLVEGLLGIRMPRRPPVLPKGKGFWERLGQLFTEAATWRAAAYLLLHMALGITYFTLLLTLLVICAAFLVIPLAFYGGLVSWDPMPFTQPPPPWLSVGLGFLGGLGLLGTLHLSLALGRLHGRYAKWLLVGA